MSQGKDNTLGPRCIKVNSADNVAIIVNEGGLPSGTVFPNGLRLIDTIPQGHKVALCDIEKGAPVIRYGEIIGYALKDLPRGSWIEESAVALPVAPDLDEVLVMAMEQIEKTSLQGSEYVVSTPPFPPSEARSGITFEGFRNPDGSVGSKNILGLIPSVQCVAGILNAAAHRIEKELLPRFPHVDGVVALNHGYGCGVAIGAPDAVIPVRTIRNLAAHPNFGGMPLIVGLGCEKLLPENIMPEASAVLPPAMIQLQEETGYAAMIDTIMKAAEERLALLEARRREPCPLSQLVVGLQCGGSDAFSGVTANPAIGYAADLLVQAGATVLFSEVTEVRDAVHLLAPRAASPGVAAALVREMRWYDEYLARGGADRSANPAPGNKKGGLANIVEKALGSSAKSGTSPIVGVLGPGERAPIYEPHRASDSSASFESAIAAQRGLYFTATPASDFICGTLQLAAGMHLQVFSTGRGTPYGLAMAPVIKVSSNSRLARQWPDVIDIDAGRIAEGEASIEEVGREIYNAIIEVASGRKKTWTDLHGLYNDLVLFNPGPVT